MLARLPFALLLRRPCRSRLLRMSSKEHHPEIDSPQWTTEDNFEADNFSNDLIFEKFVEKTDNQISIGHAFSNPDHLPTKKFIKMLEDRLSTFNTDNYEFVLKQVIEFVIYSKRAIVHELCESEQFLKQFWQITDDTLKKRNRLSAIDLLIIMSILRDKMPKFSGEIAKHETEITQLCELIITNLEEGKLDARVLIRAFYAILTHNDYSAIQRCSRQLIGELEKLKPNDLENRYWLKAYCSLTDLRVSDFSDKNRFFRLLVEKKVANEILDYRVLSELFCVVVRDAHPTEGYQNEFLKQLRNKVIVMLDDNKMKFHTLGQILSALNRLPETPSNSQLATKLFAVLTKQLESIAVFRSYRFTVSLFDFLANQTVGLNKFEGSKEMCEVIAVYFAKPQIDMQSDRTFEFLSYVCRIMSSFQRPELDKWMEPFFLNTAEFLTKNEMIHPALTYLPREEAEKCLKRLEPIHNNFHRFDDFFNLIVDYFSFNSIKKRPAPTGFRAAAEEHIYYLHLIRLTPKFIQKLVKNDPNFLTKLSIPSLNHFFGRLQKSHESEEILRQSEELLSNFRLFLLMTKPQELTFTKRSLYSYVYSMLQVTKSKKWRAKAFEQLTKLVSCRNFELLLAENWYEVNGLIFQMFNETTPEIYQPSNEHVYYAQVAFFKAFSDSFAKVRGVMYLESLVSIIRKSSVKMDLIFVAALAQRFVRVNSSCVSLEKWNELNDQNKLLIAMFYTAKIPQVKTAHLEAFLQEKFDSEIEKLNSKNPVVKVDLVRIVQSIQQKNSRDLQKLRNATNIHVSCHETLFMSLFLQKLKLDTIPEINDLFGYVNYDALKSHDFVSHVIFLTSYYFGVALPDIHLAKELKKIASDLDFDFFSNRALDFNKIFIVFKRLHAPQKNLFSPKLLDCEKNLIGDAFSYCFATGNQIDEALKLIEKIAEQKTEYSGSTIITMSGIVLATQPPQKAEVLVTKLLNLPVSTAKERRSAFYNLLERYLEKFHPEVYKLFLANLPAVRFRERNPPNDYMQTNRMAKEINQGIFKVNGADHIPSLFCSKTKTHYFESQSITSDELTPDLKLAVLSRQCQNYKVFNIPKFREMNDVDAKAYLKSILIQ